MVRAAREPSPKRAIPMARKFGAPGRELFRYSTVGALGFAVDGTLLYVLIMLGGDPYWARLCSFAVAVTVTWRLHRVWTFRTRAIPGMEREYLSYFGVQILGALTNYACYAAILGSIAPTAANALLALAVGAVLGLFVNYAGARWLVFKRRGASSNSRLYR